MLKVVIQSMQWGQIAREAIFVAVTILVLNFILPRSIVRGHSMEPELYEGNRLAGSPLPYWLHQPQRGDIVMLHPVEEEGPALVKRIVGLPGEIVEIYDGHVYVNGQLLPENYLPEPCGRVRCQNAIWRLGDNEYFIMGDNRNRSRDSRDYGPVSGDHIRAKVIFRWWPLTDLASFNPD